MAVLGWRETTERILAQKIGPIAPLLIDEVLAELGVTEQDVTASHFVKCVRSLYNKLPESLDRRTICRDLQAEVLRSYGFR